MNQLVPSTLAFFNFPMEAGHLIAIVAIVMPFLMIIFVQVAKVIGRSQQERMRYEVMRMAIERGQPIPPEVLQPSPNEEVAAIQAAMQDTHSMHPTHAELGAPGPRNDIRSGIICIGAGLGIFLFLTLFSFRVTTDTPFHLNGMGWVGAVPACVGVALLLSGLLQRKEAAAALAARRVTPPPPADTTTPRS